MNDTIRLLILVWVYDSILILLQHGRADEAVMNDDVQIQSFITIQIDVMQHDVLITMEILSVTLCVDDENLQMVKIVTV